ncbi:MAG: NAD(P)-binding domain-containing protein, partial [Pseudomonadales bacterium]
MAKIGFIGLGNMGGPMVVNLLAADHEVIAYDIVPAALDQAVAAGAAAAASAEAATAGVEVLISMLPASAHVESLYLAEGEGEEESTRGLLARIDPETLVIDCSTIASASAMKVAGVAKTRGIAMLDAPVSGGVGGAVAGTLTFIVGGESSAVEKARPILEAMGKNIFHAGDAGAGQVAKICNNMLLSVLMAGTAEA